MQTAEKCVNFLAQKFGKSPDYSDNFVAQVEDVLNLLHLDLTRSKPSDDVVQDMATIFGSYLGESFRRSHGGEWGIADGSPALRTPSGVVCFPWLRVLKRLRNGFEDNVLHWYQYLLKEGGSKSPAKSWPSFGPPPLPPQARS